MHHDLCEFLLPTLLKNIFRITFLINTPQICFIKYLTIKNVFIGTIVFNIHSITAKYLVLSTKLTIIVLKIPRILFLNQYIMFFIKELPPLFNHLSTKKKWYKVRSYF